MEKVEFLLALLRGSAYVCLSVADLLDRIDEPDWDGAGRVHDWRNYVPSAVVEHWSELPLMARAICVFMAEEQAAHEEWE